MYKKFPKKQIERHIKQHSERSTIDCDAVSTLEFFLRSDGKINTNFSRRDTWPNIDGNFELVPSPELSRRSVQNFVVQIKGTDRDAVEKDGIVKYHLDGLGFPAYAYSNATLDPCILFVVFAPKKRGKERVFWKYMSVEFLRSIDFEKENMTVYFSLAEEIRNENEAIDDLCRKFAELASRHSFAKQLESTLFTKDAAVRAILFNAEQIGEAIDRVEIYNETRDNVSKLILSRLDDLCSSVLLLNAYEKGYGGPDLRLAWEVSLMDIDTKFLCTFLQSLRYIGRRIPEDGQTERLMLKYYDFLWRIRKYLKERHGLIVLENLEKFPLDADDEDKEYLELIAQAVEKVPHTSAPLFSLRYFVSRKVPFYVNGNRYFEVTLQLAGKYASKYNRITVYTKLNISTNYSIQVGYSESDIELWKNASKIKVVTNWKVSIDPTVLNKFSAILGQDLKLSSRYGEYGSLMNYLTHSGMNFLDLIDLRQERFDMVIDHIYMNAKTGHFKKILNILKSRFSEASNETGRNTIRYLLLRLKEENIENILADEEDKKLTPMMRIKSECTPYESNPILYNLPRSITSRKIISRDVLRASGANRMTNMLPYARLKYLTETTGEIYVPIAQVSDGSDIITYNESLSEWDKKQGKVIQTNGDFAWIEEYEFTTLSILRKLTDYSKSGNEGQKQLNRNFLNEVGPFEDQTKEHAIEYAFVDCKIMLIYGAAGTGKTTLIDYLSNLMRGRSKLFVTKTHTALENLKRRITAPGQASEFVNIDRFIKKKRKADFDVVFVDECSTIDNRTMLEFLELLDPHSLIVFAGDIYQIESIEFGNWFYYVKNIIDPKAVVELTNTWRTEEENLKLLWEEVRNMGEMVPEILVIDGPFSKDIGDDLFAETAEDEIVLCLNYDGRFGLNNINNYFQDANKEHEAYRWHEWKYKVGDPILFIENGRFPELYNNLKGKIVDIALEKDSITFSIEVDRLLTGIDARNSEFEIIETLDRSTIVRFTVRENHGGPTDEEREKALLESIIPFQLAYAVSIHKSQGLEYDSVKVVIPKSNIEKISHGIFYTAITRAKRELKIFWKAETMQSTIAGFKAINEKSLSLKIIKEKLRSV